MSIRPTVCLAMIVKNEAHVIRRCLESVVAHIDSYLIHDTGSTDETIAIIKEVLCDVPGEVLERPWFNFSHNRNKVLEEARVRADYVLTMDADDWMEVRNSFPRIGGAEVYNIELRHGATSYHRPILFRTTTPGRYVGAVHEYLDLEAGSITEILPRVFVHSTREGARSLDPEKYRRDAELLEAELLREPENPRAVYYLAQSYRDAGDIELALRHYQRRAEMAGWTDEAWSSLYQIGMLRERAGIFEPEQIVGAYLRAFQFRPSRAEPLYRAGMIHQDRKEFAVSHILLGRAAAIDMPDITSLFVERDVYQVLAPLEFAVACFYVGDHTTAMRVNKTLLKTDTLPRHLRAVVQRNLELSQAATGTRRAA